MTVYRSWRANNHIPFEVGGCWCGPELPLYPHPPTSHPAFMSAGLPPPPGKANILGNGGRGAGKGEVEGGYMWT